MSLTHQTQSTFIAGIAGGHVGLMIANASWARLGHKLNRATGTRTFREVGR